MSDVTLKASIAAHNRVTGLSGNEIFCLDRMKMTAGNLVIGNSVFALGVMGKLTSGLRTLAGGEVTEITSLIHEGRSKAIDRMTAEAKESGGAGVTGVSTEIVSHGTNIEFLSIGSAVHRKPGETETLSFSTSADAQELYCQLDAGFTPMQFVFGNVAYSIGLGGNLSGVLNSLSRGEVKQYSEIFDQTRHLALERISAEAKKCGANAVVGIETTITRLMGAQEMVMIGTASKHPMTVNFSDHPVTSDMTNQEMWNMVNIGYLPLRLVMGVSVYSLGVAGGIRAAFQSLGRGELDTVTSLLYEAREKALDRIQRDAERWGADEVVGVKTHVYDLGGGLVEFLAIGTAVKKVDGLTTKSQALFPQAMIQDRETFFEDAGGAAASLGLSDRKKASARMTQNGPMAILVGVVFVIFYLIKLIFLHH